VFQASQQSPAPARPSFRVSVNLIEVDVISTDAIGTRVPDLRANDVEVTEDGKPQQIVNFEWVDLKPADTAECWYKTGTRPAKGRNSSLDRYDRRLRTPGRAGRTAGYHGRPQFCMAGTAVHFECQVFGFSVDQHPPRNPRVDMRVRLFAGRTAAQVVDSDRFRSHRPVWSKFPRRLRMQRIMEARYETEPLGACWRM